jgi:hypothetical protein
MTNYFRWDTVMVRAVGFEPTIPGQDGGFRDRCVFQFHHTRKRDEGERLGRVAPLFAFVVDHESTSCIRFSSGPLEEAGKGWEESGRFGKFQLTQSLGISNRVRVTPFFLSWLRASTTRLNTSARTYRPSKIF